MNRKETPAGPAKVMPKLCFKCGKSWLHINKCPAIGKVCLKCKKPNHLAIVCRSSFVKQIDCRNPESNKTSETGPGHQGNASTNATYESLDSDEEQEGYVYSVKGVAVNRVNTKTRVKICNRSILMQVDSGCDVNLLDEETFKTLEKTVTLSKTNKKLFPYKSTKPLQLLGKFSAVTESKTKIHVATFYVTKGNGGSLMSPDTAVELGVIKFVNQVTSTDAIIDKYEDVLRESGK